MNLSRCISALKMSLGLYGITLPFKDENTGKPIPTENIISEVLQTMTIPEYSEFSPWIREYDADVAHLKVVDRNKSIYMLPPFITMTPIKYVVDVRLPQYNNRGTYGDVAPAYGINRSVQGVVTSQAYMMVAGQMRAEPTFDYLGENKIKLYGFPKTVLTFVVAAEHDPSGESIESSCYDSFMELATLDMKVFLYNTLKLYEGIPTAFGTIDLKISDYQSAEADRTQLLERWRDVYHVDLPFYQWM